MKERLTRVEKPQTHFWPCCLWVKCFRYLLVTARKLKSSLASLKMATAETQFSLWCKTTLRNKHELTLSFLVAVLDSLWLPCDGGMLSIFNLFWLISRPWWVESHLLRKPLSYIPPGHFTLIVMLPLTWLCNVFGITCMQDDLWYVPWIWGVFSVFLQLKRFHREVITELEKKTEMDVKYMNVSGIMHHPLSIRASIHRIILHQL